MEIAIDIEGSIPVFTQLIEQIKHAVLKEKLSPGDSLPSIRQLSNDLGLNNKTVAKAYKLLERDSVIQTKGYRGTFVHPEAKANCSIDINASVTQTLNETIAEFRKSGVTDSEIRIAFSDAMNNRNTEERSYVIQHPILFSIPMPNIFAVLLPSEEASRKREVCD